MSKHRAKTGHKAKAPSGERATDDIDIEAEPDAGMFERAARAVDRITDTASDALEAVKDASLEGAIESAKAGVATARMTTTLAIQNARTEIGECDDELAAVDPSAATGVRSGVEIAARRAKATAALGEAMTDKKAQDAATHKLEVQQKFLRKSDAVAVARLLADMDREYHEEVAVAVERDFGFAKLLATLEGQRAEVSTTASEATASAASTTGTTSESGPLLPDVTGPLRTPVTNNQRLASLELQRILDAGSLEAVVAARDGLHAARADRLEVMVFDIVSFTAEGQAYVLRVAPTFTDAVISAFDARVTALQGEPAADPAWTEFAAKFRIHFGSILNAFDLGVGTNGTMTPERLELLFAPEQRDLLNEFFATNTIPDRLFDGDVVGRTTAQQRILMSSHILAVGTYKPGSITQRVHARACFHWAWIVYQYAGAQPAGRLDDGITGSFDVNGDAVLSTGRGREKFGAHRDHDLQVLDSHRDKNPDAFRYRDAPWSKVKAIEPGDWLYIYNGNKSASGAHSVIFAGWADDEHEQAAEDGSTRHYRRAFTYDQGQPDSGGGRHEIVIGDGLFATGDGHLVHPVNRIYRVDPATQPLDEAKELAPTWTKRVREDNNQFVRTREAELHGTFSPELFEAWLHRDNAHQIEVLASRDRLSEGQRTLFEAANTSSDLHALTCLSQRLRALAFNSELLADKTDKTYAEMDPATASPPDAETTELVRKLVYYETDLAEATAQGEGGEKRQHRDRGNIETLQRKLAKKARSEDTYGMVNTANSTGDVKQNIDGVYAHIPGKVPWSEIVVQSTK